MYLRPLPVALAVGLAFSANVAYAAPEHTHDSRDHSHEMRLDKGKKWRTDQAARRGMSEIRSAIAAALPQIHQDRYDRTAFARLADRVQAQVDYMVSNCKLSPEADAQFHVALDRILDGIAVMKGDSEQVGGVVAIVAALDQYREHFDHPGWKPLTHPGAASR